MGRAEGIEHVVQMSCYPNRFEHCLGLLSGASVSLRVVFTRPLVVSFSVLFCVGDSVPTGKSHLAPKMEPSAYADATVYAS